MSSTREKMLFVEVDMRKSFLYFLLIKCPFYSEAHRYPRLVQLPS